MPTPPVVPNYGVFDSKIWNPQVFATYMETVPRLKLNRLLRSGAFRMRPDWPPMFVNQTGGNYQITPYFGRINPKRHNFDGVEDFTTSGLDTYWRGIVVSSSGSALEEIDFTMSISGVDFMPEMARQINDVLDDWNTETLLAINKGIFSMTDPLDLPFVEKHTLDLTTKPGDDAMFGPTSLNTAMQRALGDNRSAFSLVIMHSYVLTRQENLNLVERLKYTDANGVSRDLRLATLNGLLVLEDDFGTFDPDTETYETLILGANAYDYADVNVKNAFGMGRDELTRGGYDYMAFRQRNIFAPNGISFTKKAMASLSPVPSEFKIGANWQLVRNSDGTKVIDHRSIPIARVLSKG